MTLRNGPDPRKRRSDRRRAICGAINAKTGLPHTMLAGWGTDHVGVGRCRFHGGTVHARAMHQIRNLLLELGEVVTSPNADAARARRIRIRLFRQLAAIASP